MDAAGSLDSGAAEPRRSEEKSSGAAGSPSPRSPQSRQEPAADSPRPRSHGVSDSASASPRRDGSGGTVDITSGEQVLFAEGGTADSSVLRGPDGKPLSPFDTDEKQGLPLQAVAPPPTLPDSKDPLQIFSGGTKDAVDNQGIVKNHCEEPRSVSWSADTPDGTPAYSGAATPQAPKKKGWEAAERRPRRNIGWQP